MADSRSSLLNHAIRVNLVKGFKIAALNVSISHLQFIGDTVVLANPSDIINVKHIIQNFELILGFKVNWRKSSITRVNVDSSLLQSLANLLGYSVAEWPLKYLGFPLGGHSHLGSFWDLTIEKFEKRLAIWKRSYISLGNKIALIKAVLSNLPAYYMSVSSMLVKVVKKLEQL